jgi:hypothetical protein
MMVEARVDCELARLGIAIPGDRDEAHGAAEPRPDAARHFVAIDLWQTDVDQRDFGGRFDNESQRVGGVRRVPHLVAVELQDRPEQLTGIPVVVDDDDPALRRG